MVWEGRGRKAPPIPILVRLSPPGYREGVRYLSKTRRQAHLVGGLILIRRRRGPTARTRKAQSPETWRAVPESWQSVPWNWRSVPTA